MKVLGLTITGGFASNGGGINNSGTLTVTNCTISGSKSSFVGGGINNSGTMTVTNSTVANKESFGNNLNVLPLIV
jgi:hypothetical protein